DAVLGVVVRRALGDDPVVHAEEEDAVAIEAVHGEAANDGAVDPQTRVGEAGRTPVARLGDGDALLLTTRVLDDDGLAVRGGPPDPDPILGPADPPALPRL